MKTRLLFLFVAVLIVLIGCSKSSAVATAPPAASTPMDEVGIPLYPGSNKVSLEVAAPLANGSKRVQAEYSSPDSYDKVVQFYKDKLGLQGVQLPGAKLNQLVGKTPHGDFVQILIGPNGANSKIQYYFILPAKA